MLAKITVEWQLGGRRVAALNKCQQVLVHPVLKRGWQSVWSSFVHFQNSAFYDLRRQHRRSHNRYDLIVAAVNNECRHIELLKILGQVRLGENLDAVVGGFDSRRHSL